MTVKPRKSLPKIKDETNFYEHQILGVRKMAKMDSFLLADEMGLGKSLQALTVSAVHFNSGYAERIIVVCPATLKWNWLAEIEQFTHFTATVLDGSPKQREAQLDKFDERDADENPLTDILIVNYEQVGAHLKRLNQLCFDIAIFDEAHYIKSYNSKRTVACLKLQAYWSFVLTGSPMLNRVDELWPLLHRIDPERFPSWWRFVNRFAVYGGYKDKQIIGVKNKPELNLILSDPDSGVMIRRLKSEVLDLPEKQHITTTVHLTAKQRKYYNEALNDLKVSMPEGQDDLEIENALVKFLKLKQVCGTLRALGPDFPDESAKLDAAVEEYLQLWEAGEKVVIFTQFRDVQDCFIQRLEKSKEFKGTVYRLAGDVKMPDRQPIIEKWKNSKNPDPLVAMLQVASVGLNLTVSSHAFFLDELYVPKLNEQAEDRLHRIGASKTQPIQIHHYICADTIESRIQQILRAKRKLFDSLIEDNDYKRALMQALKEEV